MVGWLGDIGAVLMPSGDPRDWYPVTPVQSDPFEEWLTYVGWFHHEDMIRVDDVVSNILFQHAGFQRRRPVFHYTSPAP